MQLLRKYGNSVCITILIIIAVYHIMMDVNLRAVHKHKALSPYWHVGPIIMYKNFNNTALCIYIYIYIYIYTVRARE